jgi:hypothetical protein
MFLLPSWVVLHVYAWAAAAALLIAFLLLQPDNSIWADTPRAVCGQLLYLQENMSVASATGTLDVWKLDTRDNIGSMDSFMIPLVLDHACYAEYAMGGMGMGALVLCAPMYLLLTISHDSMAALVSALQPADNYEQDSPAEATSPRDAGFDLTSAVSDVAPNPLALSVDTNPSPQAILHTSHVTVTGVLPLRGGSPPSPSSSTASSCNAYSDRKRLQNVRASMSRLSADARRMTFILAHILYVHATHVSTTII